MRMVGGWIVCSIYAVVSLIVYYIYDVPATKPIFNRFIRISGSK